MKKRRFLGTLVAVFLAHLGATFSEQGDWQRDPRPILTNFDNMYGPTIVETKGDYPFKMWFFGWAAGHANPGLPGADAIFHARSRDLLRWEVYAGDQGWDKEMEPANWVPVVVPGEAWYDCWHNGDPSVVYRDGVYAMAYTATSKEFEATEGYPLRMVSCVMGALSDDGIHWEKTAHPLLIAPEDRPTPAPNPCRMGDYARPSLHWEDGQWKMWMDYWIPGKGVCLGLAENRGRFEEERGFRVVHDLDAPLLVDWPNPDVVRIGNKYHAFADPGGWPIDENDSHWMTRQLREAVSSDGLRWERAEFIPPDSDADACHVPHAFLANLNGERWLYLFYATQIGNRKRDGVYHYQYDKIRAMRRKVAVNEAP